MGNFLGKLPCLVYINISLIQAIHLLIQPIFVKYILGIGAQWFIKYQTLENASSEMSQPKGPRYRKMCLNCPATI